MSHEQNQACLNGLLPVGQTTMITMNTAHISKTSNNLIQLEGRLFFPPMSTLCIATFVKSSHRFISRPSLYLHEIGSFVLAFWASFLSGIHILPSSRTPENIIHLLQFGKFAMSNFLNYVVNKRASRTCKSVTSISFFNSQHISAGGAKQPHFRQDVWCNVIPELALQNYILAYGILPAYNKLS